MAETKATIETKFGTIELKFFPDVAPNHVKNFTDLAKRILRRHYISPRYSGLYDTGRRPEFQKL